MSEENMVPDAEPVGDEGGFLPMSLQVEDFFEPDTGYAVILDGDFRVVAADTTPELYATRVLAKFTAACATAPGINSVLALYQPFYECFIDRNRRFHKSTDFIKFQLAAIYTNDKTYNLYEQIEPTPPAPPEGGE